MKCDICEKSVNPKRKHVRIMVQGMIFYYHIKCQEQDEREEARVHRLEDAYQKTKSRLGD